jgi:hypothetical protein
MIRQERSDGGGGAQKDWRQQVLAGKFEHRFCDSDLDLSTTKCNFSESVFLRRKNDQLIVQVSLGT